MRLRQINGLKLAFRLYTLVVHIYETRMIDFGLIEGFDWDEGNLDKNLKSHKVANVESEQIFFNEPLMVYADEKHSTGVEPRFAALGRTDSDRLLFVSFTIRKNLIRIISARDMSKKERKAYHEKA